MCTFGAGSESPLSEALLSMMGAPCVPQGSSWSHRFLQLAWAFFSLVLLNTYTAGLAALFTVQSLTQTFNSLEAVANSYVPRFSPPVSELCNLLHLHPAQVWPLALFRSRFPCQCIANIPT